MPRLFFLKKKFFQTNGFLLFIYFSSLIELCCNNIMADSYPVTKEMGMGL